jgi:acetyl esterase
VHNLQIPGPGGHRSLRIYVPGGQGPFGVLVFFHGSGFSMLDLDTHDEICRRLCASGGCVVASLDYRLAPEHPFPAAPDDCLAAVRWMADHAARFKGDAARMGVSGDSAGGCLAAVTAMRVRDEGGPRLCAQLLMYPVTDHHQTGYGSYTEFGTGFGLRAEAMRWYWDQYLPDAAMASDPRAAPLRMQSMAGLPPAYVMVAEYDVLRDEGTAYARRLQADDVPVVAVLVAGMNHGFLRHDGLIPEAGAALDAACTWLRENLG